MALARARATPGTFHRFTVLGLRLPARFICTYAVAEQLYRAKDQIATLGEIRIDSTTLSFWADLLAQEGASQQPGTTISRKTDKKRFDKILDRFEAVADAFMAVANKYTVKGRMSEQISR